MREPISIFNKPAPSWLEKRRNIVLFQVAFWLLYYVFYVWQASFDMTLKIAAWSSLYDLIIVSSFVYLNTLFLIPRFLYKKKYALYFVSLFLNIFISSEILLNENYFLPDCCDQNPLEAYPWIYQISIYILNNGLEIIALSSVKILNDWVLTRSQFAEMEKKQLQSELKFLKAQINPHFLFNTLNNIYFLIKKNPEQAADALQKLSEILRIQLYDTNDEKMLIEKEIDYIKNYIELEKLRNDPSLEITCNVNGDYSQLSIPPFLFLTLTENAFKHSEGIYKENKRWIHIQFDFTENKIIFQVENSKPGDEKNDIDNKRKGIGLPNLKKRLSLLYDKKHDLHIQETDTLFKVTLTIIR